MGGQLWEKIAKQFSIQAWWMEWTVYQDLLAFKQILGHTPNSRFGCKQMKEKQGNGPGTRQEQAKA